MNNFSNINKLIGFQDKFSRDLSFTNKLEKEFIEFVETWGYEQVRTPVLERSDLFNSKTGTSLTSNIYSFRDPSGTEVSLRPDFTSSIMRMILEKELDYSDIPLRFSYTGEIFRYNSEADNFISQNGIELIGNSNLVSDIEVLSMSINFSKKIVGDDLYVKVGHVGILTDIFSFYNLSDRESLFILQNLDFISSEKSVEIILKKANQTGIIIDDGIPSIDKKELSDVEISKMLDFAFSEDSNFNQTRDKDSILEGIKNNFSKNSNSKNFSECISLISKLINIDTNLDESVSLANELLVKIPVKKNLSDFYTIVKNLENYNIDISNFKIDFGLVREWGYYSGFVINLYAKGFGDNNSFGGGGRYDYSSKTNQIPATGFAVDTEKILENSILSNIKKNTKKIIIYAKDKKDFEFAQRTSFEERNTGSVVLLDTMTSNLDKVIDWAKKNDFSEVMVINQNNVERKRV